MESLAALVLLLLPVLVAGLALVGSLLRYAVRRALRAPAAPAGSWLGTLIRLTEDVALGATVLVLSFVLASVFGVALAEGFALGALALAVAVFLARLVWDRESVRWPARAAADSGRWALGAAVGLLAVLLVSRLVPYVSLTVYSGNDIRLFTLITELVKGHGGFVSSYGAFAGPTWSVATDPHLTFAGSEAVFYVLNLWVPWNTPQLVSAATICFNILIPFSALVFFRRLLPGRPEAVPVLGAVSLAIFAAYPQDFLQWGGIDETVGWFLFPIALALLLEYIAGKPRDLLPLLLGGLTFGAVIVVSPLAFFYTLAFLGAYVVYLIVARGQLVRPFGSVLSFGALALVVASPIIYHEVSGWLHYTSSIPAGYAGWGTFETAVIFRPGDVAGSLWRFATLTYPLGYVLFLTITGWAGLFMYIRREPLLVALIAWIAILLILNTDGPFGLFWVQYPFWTFLYPDRTAHVIFIPLSAGSGLVLARVFELRWPHAPPTPAHHWRAQPRKRQGLLFALLAAMLIVGGTCAVEMARDNASTVYWGSSLTPTDVTVFDWMETHVPAGSTVLVNPADSGTWMPEFTGIRVFPYGELIDNPAVYDQTQEIPSLFNTTDYGPALGLMHEYNLSYVFFGSRVQYSFSPGLSLAEFTAAPPIASFVTASALCAPSSSNTTVRALVCAGDTVDIHGPALLQLTERHNGTIVLEDWVGVSQSAGWSFTLETNTTAYPGTWTAEISTQPIAPQLFNAGASKLLAFNPVFLQLESDPSAPVIVPVASPLFS